MLGERRGEREEGAREKKLVRRSGEVRNTHGNGMH
jgi:hypothetical protein